MSIAFVVGASAYSTNNNTATTSGVDTTGANFLIIAHGDYDARATESDSKGNAYTDLTAQNNTGNRGSQLHYCENPTVGSGHTATATSSTGYPSIQFGAFSGVATSSAFDQQNGATSAGTPASFQPGSVTPSEDNELVVSCVCTSVASAWTASGYTAIATYAPAGANSVGLAAGYQIQTTATATNPMWSGSSSSNISANIATFKAAAAAGQPFGKRWGGVTHNGYTRRGVW